MLKTKRILQPMILATILGAGFAVVWGVLALWIQGVSSSHDRVVAVVWSEGQQLFFLLDGTPVIQN